MAKKVITFGEIMLRLAPEGYYRFVQADTFGATYGGGEANVAVSLANYGFDAKFVTKLPKHEIRQAANGFLLIFSPSVSCRCNNLILICDTCNTACCLCQRFCIFFRKHIQLTDRRIFLQNNLSLSVRKDFHWVAFSYS